MSLRVDLPQRLKGRPMWVAYSGGLDSTVLLHALKTQGVRPLRAIHVHHGLQKAADAWAVHGRKFCRSIGVPFTLKRVRVAKHNAKGPEAAAREARYKALRKHLKKNDCLVTAHHADDQAETLLLRLLRGSGVRGLAAMRPLSETHWRPLLNVSRAELLDYANTHELKWIEDPHNRDPQYARSWLRQELMPALQQRYPALLKTLTQNAALHADASDLLDEYGAEDLRRFAAGPVLKIPALKTLSAPRRNHVLRVWLEHNGQLMPSAKGLAQIERELLAARTDADPVITLGDAELRRYRDGLHLLPKLPPVPTSAVIRWNGRGRLKLPAGCGVLVGTSSRPIANLEVRFPSGGEKLRPAGDRHTRTLKNLCQQAGVPPWVRQRMPLVYRDGELVAIADRWRSGRATMRLKWDNPLEVVSSLKRHALKNH